MPTSLSIGNSCFAGSTAGINGLNLSNGVDYMGDHNPANYTGDITEVRANWTSTNMSSGSTMKFKVWRRVGGNLNFIGQTEPFEITNVITGCNVFTVNSVITGIQTGDLMGYWLSGQPNASIQVTLANTTVSRGFNGDHVTDTLESNWTPQLWRVPIGLFVGDTGAGPQPDPPNVPVRAKDPATGDVVQFITDYGYRTSGVLIRKRYRSLTGALLSQRYNDYGRYEVPIVTINSADHNNLKRWLRERVELFFTENHSVSTVDSGFSVKIKEINLTQFREPMSQLAWSGEVVLETI